MEKSEVEFWVVRDPEIMGGEPVLRGTRVPARTVAAWARNGESKEAIKKAYPSVTDEMVEAALIWASLHPQAWEKGEPSWEADRPGWTLVSKRKVRLKKE